MWFFLGFILCACVLVYAVCVCDLGTKSCDFPNLGIWEQNLAFA